jgi:hypothetical protein
VKLFRVLSAGICVVALASGCSGKRGTGPLPTRWRSGVPGKVKAAIEHLVEVGGAQVNDPGFNDANSAIEQWVKEICPT